jgi:hypothetical protein
MRDRRHFCNVQAPAGQTGRQPEVRGSLEESYAPRFCDTPKKPYPGMP